MDDNTLTAVFKAINDFDCDVKAGGQEIMKTVLPFELTAKERADVHEYIKSKGLFSESLVIKGSNLKKIVVHNSVSLDAESKSENKITQEDVDLFASQCMISIPCTDPKYIEYYVEQFDALYGTKKLWHLFLDERNKFVLKKEIADTMSAISKDISEKESYKKLMDKKIKGVKDKIRKDVYHFGSEGKVFLSVDIRKGNFTTLKHHCPDLFMQGGASLNWEEYVGKFTDSKFVAKSKYFREVVFGRTGFCKRATSLQELIMDDVHQTIINHPVYDLLELKMKAGDENVYEIKDLDSFMKQAEDLKNLINSSEEYGSIFHFRVFTVKSIETKPYFLKTFHYSSDWFNPDGSRIPEPDIPLKYKIEFKRVPKKFLLQIIKWQRGDLDKIEARDLKFMDEGIEAQYQSTIFD